MYNAYKDCSCYQRDETIVVRSLRSKEILRAIRDNENMALVPEACLKNVQGKQREIDDCLSASLYKVLSPRY